VWGVRAKGLEGEEVSKKKTVKQGGGLTIRKEIFVVRSRGKGKDEKKGKKRRRCSEEKENPMLQKKDQGGPPSRKRRQSKKSLSGVREILTRREKGGVIGGARQKGENLLGTASSHKRWGEERGQRRKTRGKGEEVVFG